MTTHYDVLGVSPNADADAIKAAYRRAMKTHHPDVNAGDEAARLLSRTIIDAYTVLKDPTQRWMYDQFLAHRRRKRRAFIMTALAGTGAWCTIALLVLQGIFDNDPIATAVQTPVPPERPARIALIPEDFSLLHGPDKSDLRAAPRSVAEPVPAADLSSPTAASPNEIAKSDRGSSQSAASEAAGDGAPAIGVNHVAAPSATPASAAEGSERHEPKSDEIVTGSLEISDKLTPNMVPPPATPSLGDEKPAAALVPSSASPAPPSPVAAAALPTNPGGTEKEPTLTELSILSLERSSPDFDLHNYLRRSAAWNHGDDYGCALADYDLALRFNESIIAAYRIKYKVKSPEERRNLALAELDRVVRESFSDAQIYYDRGLIWTARGRSNRAIADFNKAISLSGNFGRAYFHRGMAYLRLSNIDDALADFDRALMQDPSLTEASQARHFVLVARSRGADMHSKCTQ